MPQIRIPLIGAKGLLRGLAAEDAAPEGLHAGWNLRADKLGRLEPRTGYKLLAMFSDTPNRETPSCLFSLPATTNPEIFCLIDPSSEANWWLYHYNRTTSAWDKITATSVERWAVVRTHAATIYSSDAAQWMGYIAAETRDKGADKKVRILKIYKSGANWKFCALGIGDPDTSSLSVTQWATDLGWAGTWQIKVAFYNSVTKTYGIMSPTPLEVTFDADKKSFYLNNIPTYPSTAVGDQGGDIYRKIYVRKSTWAANTWHLQVTINDNTDTQLDPTEVGSAVTEENASSDYPANWTAPPLGGDCVAEFLGRLWVALDSDLYFSDADNPDHFSTGNVLHMRGRILSLAVKDRMLHVIQDTCREVIPYTDSITAATLSIVQVSEIGLQAAAKRTVTVCDDGVVFRNQDDVLLTVGKGARSIANIGIRDILSRAEPDSFACYEATKNRLHLFLRINPHASDPDIGYSGMATDSANRHLIYEFTRKIWYEDFEPGVYPTVAAELWLDSTATEKLILGGYWGVTAVCEYNSAAVDGGTAVESGTVTASGNNTLTDSSKSWTTNEWRGMGVLVFNASSSTPWSTAEFRPIISNTATQLTVGLNWSTNPTTACRYVIGSIMWFLRTPFLKPALIDTNWLVDTVGLSVVSSTNLSSGELMWRVWREMPHVGGATGSSVQGRVTDYTLSNEMPVFWVFPDVEGRGVSVELAGLHKLSDWRFSDVIIDYSKQRHNP